MPTVPVNGTACVVRLEKEGRIICSVNGQVLIDLVDQSLKDGRIGLCKFRAPSAEFRKFRHSKRFAQSSIPPALVQKIRLLSGSLNEDSTLRKKTLMTWSIKDQWLRRLSLTTRLDWKEKPNA